jgi:hypothetical protein
MIYTPISRGVDVARKIAFISKYSSRSMDQATYAYYNRLATRYSSENVSIIQDSQVLNGNTSWNETVDSNDLFFVMSLSDMALGANRTEFCRNLASVLKRTKGIVFAGNSSAYISANLYGCVYTSYFGFADAANNLQTSSTVKVVREHPVTVGYELREYNLSQTSTIYTIRSPKKDGLDLANAASYPFLMVWENVTYRAAVWGIENPDLECSSCLGWNIFDNMIAWVANREDMGIKIDFDKSAYAVGDTIEITVRSPVSVSSVTGKITYPDGKEYNLAFFGSGKIWNASYPLLKTDPPGEYTVSVKADDDTKITKARVKIFKIDITISNRTDGADIFIDVFDFSGNQLKNVSLDVGITYPSGRKIVYGFVSNQTIHIDFKTTEDGNHTLLITGTDGSGRTDYETGDFWVETLKPLPLALDPDSVDEDVTAPANLSQVVDIQNNGNVSITNISITKLGNATAVAWIRLLNSTLPDIPVNGSSKLYFDIRVPVVGEGEYLGTIRISAKQGFKEIPIQLKVTLKATLSITPASFSEYIPIGDKILKEFVLENKGNVNLTVREVMLEGNVANIDHKIEKPNKILVGTQEKMKITLDTSDLVLTAVSKRYSGSVSIETDRLKESLPANITVIKDLVKELSPIQSLLSKAEANISKLSQSTLEESDVEAKVVSAKGMINDVKNLYQDKNYGDALTKFDSLESKVNEIVDEVLNLQDVEYEKNKLPRLAMNALLIFFVSIAVFLVVIWFINRRGVSGDQYSWLYKKYMK